MKRHFLELLTLANVAGLLVWGGCAAFQSAPVLNDTRTAANLAADISNATQQPLVDAYRLEGLACVNHDAGVLEHDAGALFEQTTRACFARVDAEWLPVWSARARVQDAQHALADAIEARTPTDDTQRLLVAAWCTLRVAATPKLVLPALGVCQ